MNVVYSDHKIPVFVRNSIFLAGPTPRDKNVLSWRPEAVAYLEKCGFSGTVFVPERLSGFPPEHYDKKVDCYDTQVEWEDEALRKCDVVVFWVPRKFPEMMALTTNVEFGRFMGHKRTVYGRPDESVRNRYLDWLSSRLKTQPLNGLEATLNEAVKLASKPRKIWFVADWHLGETRMEIMQRPFFGPDAMFKEMLANHNSVVAPEDDVIMVGDAISKSSDKDRRQYYLDCISYFHGSKWLIRGNHDELFTDEEFKPYFHTILPNGAGFEMSCVGTDGKEIPLWVVHYPTQARADRFNIVGHIHSAWKYQLNSLNVGVDVHNFAPVNIDRIPFFLTAVTSFYDEDVWVGYHNANASFRGVRGKPGSYFTLQTNVPA